MRTERSDSRLKNDSLPQKLQHRLSLSNIYKELDLIANMNRNLEIKMHTFANIDILRPLKKDELLKVAQQIPFITYQRGNEGKC
jgi:hypothetical protein